MTGSGTNAANFSLLLSRFSSTQQWDRVWDCAHEWLALEPENLRAHLAAGQAAVQLKRYPEARPHLLRVLQGDPNNNFAHRLLSIVQFYNGEHAAADESIRQAIALDPNQPYNWYHLGWMCYRQGAPSAARDCLEKARELAPNDPNIINLLALCEPPSPDAAARKFRQYRLALELDPENSDVHNNLGTHYLNVEHDLKEAEACFRRSLALNPSSVIARKNLFFTLKKRDRIFRILSAPSDFLKRVAAYFRKSPSRSILLYLLILPLWILTARYVWGVIILWFLLVWPVIKVYERFTLGDIRAQIGEIGARKGGLFGYRGWPLKVRLGIFAAFLVAFWGGIAGSIYYRKVLVVSIFFMFLLATFLILFFTMAAVGIIKSMRMSRERAHGKKRAKIVANLLPATASKTKGWNPFRRKPAVHD